MSETMVYINDGACHRYVSNTVNIQKRNLMVIAKLDNGFFYPGHVIQQWGKPEEAEVNFYQWGPRRVHRNNVISISGSVCCPPLHAWDYVLTRMRVTGPRGMYMQYMPGRVCYVPRLPPLEHRCYSIRLYNGKVVEKKRKLLVKISKSRYRGILSCIGLDGCPRKRCQKDKSMVFLSDDSDYDDDDDDDDDDDSGDSDSDSKKEDEKERKKKEAENERGRKKKKERRHGTKKDESCKVFVIGGSLERKPKKEKQCSTTKIEKAIQTVGERIDQNGDKIVQEIQTSQRQVSEHLGVLHRQMEKTTELKEVKGQIINAKINKVSGKMREEIHATGKKIVNEIKALGKKCKEKRTSTPPPRSPISTQVLAKWEDDGLYRFGCIKTKCGDGIVWVEDSCNHKEEIDRDSILTEEDRIRPPIKSKGYVIALLPSYSFGPGKNRQHRYGPGKIIKDGREIKFYNGVIVNVQIDMHIYKITKETYNRDVKGIKEDIRGKKVLVLDEDTGRYILTDIVNPLGKETGYFVWPNKNVGKGKYVAAPVKDGDETYYLPAKVVRDSSGTQTITYCNGTRETNIHGCYLLDKRCYMDAVECYKRNEENTDF
ncbi:uncharacterized protein LOC128228175 isoform X2 [Mya arenaria]|uniref:uncharacterized protein LOC128228175 isoform X2 n=1 Tax=Mya arenaria TaxID=6604 RepID=UPI0022E56382|nr:uncharacterized protein LOC128228175 isoform X2 [Mya arenaria]